MFTSIKPEKQTDDLAGSKHKIIPLNHKAEILAALLSDVSLQQAELQREEGAQL